MNAKLWFFSVVATTCPYLLITASSAYIKVHSLYLPLVVLVLDVERVKRDDRRSAAESVLIATPHSGLVSSPARQPGQRVALAVCLDLGGLGLGVPATSQAVVEGLLFKTIVAAARDVDGVPGAVRELPELEEVVDDGGARVDAPAESVGRLAPDGGQLEHGRIRNA